jgi:anti-sigma factor RsiW
MTINDTELDHLDDAELLLPWYVTGTLSAKQTQQVETWLKDNPEAQAHLARVEEEQHVAISAAEEISMPRATAVNDLMAAIGQTAPAPRQSEGIAERFINFITPRWAMAGMAALALVVVAQGTVGTLVSDTQSFQTASGTAATIEGPSALVAFQPDLSLGEISDYLATHQLRIIDGPKPGGIYRIAAEDSAEGATNLQNLGDDKSFVNFFSLSR